jgi:hypothetical protein
MEEVAVRVEIRRLVDESNPGVVECWLTDAEGREWSFVEKVPVVTAEYLDAQSHYPCEGIIAGRVIGRGTDAEGGEVVVIDTVEPWGVEATTGEARFTVRPEQLVPYE